MDYSEKKPQMSQYLKWRESSFLYYSSSAIEEKLCVNAQAFTGNTKGKDTMCLRKDTTFFLFQTIAKPWLKTTHCREGDVNVNFPVQ